MKMYPHMLSKAFLPISIFHLNQIDYLMLNSLHGHFQHPFPPEPLLHLAQLMDPSSLHAHHQAITPIPPQN